MSSETSDSKPSSGDNVRITIGDNARNVAAGKNVHQDVMSHAQAQVSQADIAAIGELFTLLRDQIQTQAPADKKDSAIERVEELREAVTSQKPDLTTMDYVKKWFEKHLPQLAGAVTSVLLNPVVGKVVEATGELAVGELKRRFEHE